MADNSLHPKSEYVNCILTGLRLDTQNGTQRSAFTESGNRRILISLTNARPTDDSEWIEVNDGYNWSPVTAATMKMWLRNENLPEDSLDEIEPEPEPVKVAAADEPATEHTARIPDEKPANGQNPESVNLTPEEREDIESLRGRLYMADGFWFTIDLNVKQGLRLLAIIDRLSAPTVEQIEAHDAERWAADDAPAAPTAPRDLAPDADNDRPQYAAADAARRSKSVKLTATAFQALNLLSLMGHTVEFDDYLNRWRVCYNHHWTHDNINAGTVESLIKRGLIERDPEGEEDEYRISALGMSALEAK